MRRSSATRNRLLLAVLLLACISTGCASTSSKWVSLRTTPRNPLSDSLGLLTRQGPEPTERTVQLLRRYDLEDSVKGDTSQLLTQLAEIDKREPNRENVYAMAELAYVGAHRADRSKDCGKALELYGTAVLHAYRYLFDQQYSIASNPYDPEFRRACDLYNGALESTLRIVQTQESLRPGRSLNIKTATHDCQLEIKLNGSQWHNDDFDHFQFVSDFEVHGLTNHYHNYGLGVPLIAVRSQHEDMEPEERFYPKDLSFPVTAFLRVMPKQNAEITSLNAVLELHDPLEEPSVQVAQHIVPLETDLSTPLAHTLSQPSLDDTQLSTLGLLNPSKIEKLQGLYMLEPFQEDKIPVVMVHGLWSSPVTWMEMFNDLRSDPQIRKHYQFWFYLYPSGQPFWFSAAQMRADLAYMQQTLDPDGKHPALDQSVLVGHSMGGLVSKLQTLDSGNHFWGTMSERPFAELQAEKEIRDGLAKTFFFDPDPSVQRVITIGTPHRGSKVANDTTRWLGRKLIKIPSMIMQGRHQLVSLNPGYFRKNTPLDITTSIDSLAPDSPLWPVMLTAKQGNWVKYHNIVGQVPKKGLAGFLVDGSGDGVVSLASAQLEGVQSEVVVPADHVSVHRHPQSIIEVRRILMQHVAELRSFPYDKSVQPASTPTDTPQPTTSNSEANIARELLAPTTR